MRVPNFFGWVKADGIVELPDRPFLIWTAYGMDLVSFCTVKEDDDFSSYSGSSNILKAGESGLISLMSCYWYNFDEVLYYRKDIQGPEGQELTGIDWLEWKQYSK